MAHPIRISANVHLETASITYTVSANSGSCALPGITITADAAVPINAIVYQYQNSLGEPVEALYTLEEVGRSASSQLKLPPEVIYL